MSTETTTALPASATVAAAYAVQLTAGKDRNAHSSRTFEVTLFDETLATGADFKTRQAAGKAGQKVAHKFIAAMLEETPEAREIVKLAAAARALADAKKWEAWSRKAEALKVATAAFLAA